MNSPGEGLINFFLSISIWSVAKILVCFALFLYVFFAFVVIRQVNLMTQALNGQLESFLKLVAWLHFLAAIFILLLAIVIL